jgi:hypothetical protein
MSNFALPKKLITLFFALLIICPIAVGTFPQRTVASGIVFDPTNYVKNTITSIQTQLVANTSIHTLLKDVALDPLAWIVSKATLQSVVKSMVTWAAHGFNGAPSFVTDLNKQLLSVGDTAANGFLSQLSSNGSIKSPFQTAVASAVGTNYAQSTSANGFFTQNAFTLGQASPNPTTALNGGMFTQQGGGINAWLSAWSNPANNPFGASMLASNALGSQVSNAQSIQKNELNWAQGLLSPRGNCPQTTTGGTTQTTSSGGTVSLSAPSTCQSQPIQTPGSIVKSSLEKALGSGIDTLVSARSFDEIISSVLGQLINQVVGSGSGLAGISQPSSSTNGTSWFNQPADSTQVATSNGLSTSFASTITGQITQIQQFSTEWTTILNAANTAKATLTNDEPCNPNAQTTITSTVQPVIAEATSSLAEASTSVAALEAIQAQLPPANSTTDQTAAISALSNTYTNLLQTDPLLSNPNAIGNAVTQSTDTSVDPSQPQSLFSQMSALAQPSFALTCQRIVP